MKLELSLVFAVPIAENTFGFGQLVAHQSPIFYMVGYGIKAESCSVTDEGILAATPILMGNFFDVLIQNGRWPVVKRLKTREVPCPCFKIKIGDKFFVETWDKSRTREATPQECAILPFRTNHSAILLEDALKAYFGFKPWESKWFDPLKADIVSSVANLV